MPDMILFGAGNIGRSFIAPIFADAGYRITFFDTQPRLVAALNQHRTYPIHTMHPDGSRETRWVGPVSAEWVGDGSDLSRALQSCDLIATSVGAAHLPAVARTIGPALRDRTRPVNVLLAENAHRSHELMAGALAEFIPRERLADRVGLIPSCIGKMVPTPVPGVAGEHPLALRAEPFHTLILGRKPFLGTPVPSPHIEWVEPMEPWLDRKLFLHNLPHAAAAWATGYHRPEVKFLADGLTHDAVLQHVRRVMSEAMELLLKIWPGVFTADKLSAHAEDLLSRFQNPYLGDTVHRVGRDLRRKLGPDERIVGAMRQAVRVGIPFPALARTWAQALHFRATDETGSPFPADAALFQDRSAIPVEEAIADLSHLNPKSDLDATVIQAIQGVHLD